jgi:3-oxoacyl-[acyl-carrier protein] reductase
VNSDNPAAIVTGAASGMGRAFAQRFLDAGWTVVAMDLDGNALEAVKGELGSASDRFIPAPADVRDRAAVREAIRVSGADSNLKAAVTAAGIYPPTNLDTFTDEIFHRTMDINVLGTLNVAAEAIAVMRAHSTKGAIVTISSADAFTSSTQQLIYSASKAAVVSLTRVLARTVAAEDIIVNGIAPGWVDTPGNAATGRMVGAEKHIPLGRVAQPEELAEWVWALASRTSVSFMTGETLKVTGGELVS